MIAILFNADNYTFNPYAAPPFLTAVAALLLGIIVLIGERGSRVSFSFFIMTAVASLWLLSYSLMYCARTEFVAAAWATIGQLGVCSIPAAVYYFTVSAVQAYPRHRNRVWAAWLSSAVFAVTAIESNAFFEGVYAFGWGYYPRYRWLTVPYLVLFIALMAASLRCYWRAYHGAAQPIARQKNKSLLIAFCVGYLGSVDFFAAYGVPLYPFGYLPIFGFVFLAARAVWRYRLIDITPAFAAEKIIDAMTDALLVLDNEGIVRVANSAARRLFDLPEQELLGVSIKTLAPGLALPVLEPDRRNLSSDLRDLEFELATPRAAIVAVSVSCYAMRDQDQAVAFVCIFRNISQRKKAEAEIRRHTDRQTALYEINLATTSTLESGAVLDVLLEKVTALVPQTATTVMLLDASGRRLVKVAARGCDEREWKAAADGADALAAHPALARKDAVVVEDIKCDDGDLQSSYFCKQGFISYLGVPLIAKDKALGILSFYSRRPRRFTEDEINFLKTLAGQAAGAIANSQLYEQTRKQAADLKKANHVKDEFLSVMSHELRTPLNVIAGYTKIVQDGMLGAINAEQNKALDKVSRHANELLLMVESIMNATKIEAGAVIVEAETFSLAAFLDDLRTLYDYPLGKDVVLEWNHEGELPIVRTDRDKLKHIVQNLINNALKFTDRGFVKILARQVPGTDRVELTVSDTGVGIAPEDLAKIFDRFRQADSSRTRSHGGIGLGLHIAKTFTALLGGTVKAASQPGRGSAFTVTIPCVYNGDGIRSATQLRRDDPDAGV